MPELSDVVFYDIEKDCFVSASSHDINSFSAFDFNPDRHIFIGIIVGIYSENVVDVFMCSFLFDEPIKLPQKTTKFSDKDIRKKIADLFQKTVNQMRDQSPNYKKIRELQISVPTVEQIYLLSENPSHMFSGYDIAFGNYKFRPFFKRMFNDGVNIVCSYNKKLYFVKCNSDGEKPSVEIPHKGKFDFLCVFKKVVLN